MVLTYSVPQLGEGVQHVRNVCLAKNQKKSETRLSTVGRLIEVKRTAFITIQKNIVRVSSRDLLDVFQCLRETSRTTATPDRFATDRQVVSKGRCAAVTPVAFKRGLDRKFRSSPRGQPIMLDAIWVLYLSATGAS